MMTNSHFLRCGVTLVEILMVAVILVFVIISMIAPTVFMQRTSISFEHQRRAQDEANYAIEHIIRNAHLFSAVSRPANPTTGNTTANQLIATLDAVNSTGLNVHYDYESKSGELRFCNNYTVTGPNQYETIARFITDIEFRRELATAGRILYVEISAQQSDDGRAITLDTSIYMAGVP